jgi:hypothetical protein
MAQVRSNSLAHNLACSVAESTRQSAVAAAGSNQAAVAAADIQFYRSVVASSKINNTGSDLSVALQALRALGPGQ